MRASNAILSSQTLLLFFSAVGLVVAADCDKGEKEKCFCECETIQSHAQGTGPCSISEKRQKWCSISYGGNTGSLGPSSRGPDSSFKAPESLAQTSSLLKNGIPNHQTKEYADLVRSVLTALNAGPFFSPAQMRAAGIAGKKEAQDALFLLGRASYISSPRLSSKEVNALDTALANAIYREGFDKRFYQVGYLRINVSDISVQIIYREFMERKR